MVNYRRFVCEVVILCTVLGVTAAAPTPDCKHTLIDQRQNGSENYRLNIDGVVFAVAPVDSLLSALGDFDDISDLLALEELGFDKPKPPQSSSPLSGLEFTQVANKPKPEEKPSEEKPLDEKPSEEKPQELKPAVSVKPIEATPLSDVNVSDDDNIQKKEVSQKKPDKAKRLKNRLAAFLLPLLRKTRHH